MRQWLILVLLFQIVFAWKPIRRITKIPGSNNEDSDLNSNQVEHWFDQKLDHYAPENRKMWKQRYFVEDKHFKIGSPVFLIIGEEDAAIGELLELSICKPYAERFKPLCFMLERRFYGKSHPTVNMSVENLKSLTTEQVLGDIAFFIEGMNRKYNLTQVNKWVTFGGSYAGSLSAWMRLKFPHFVHAAVASSAPLQLVPEFGYFNLLRYALASSNQECLSAISSANKELETLLKHRKERPEDIDTKFKLCDSVVDASESDVSNLHYTLALETLGQIVLPVWSQGNKTVCNLMTNTSLGSPLERFAEFNRLNLRIFSQTCLDYKYQKIISRYRNESWEYSSTGGRQWMYQMCTELGMFETTTFENNTFGNYFPLDFMTQFCSDIFGSSINKERLLSGISLVNFMYGGLDIEVRRVIYAHDSRDPWHALSISKSDDPEAPVILKNVTSYIESDMEEEDSEAQWMATVKAISDHLAKWL